MAAYRRLPDLRIGATPDYWLDDDGLTQVGTVSLKEWRGEPPLYAADGASGIEAGPAARELGCDESEERV